MHVALALGGLLLEDVAREGVTGLHLAGAGDLEALLRAGVGLHLGHGEGRSIAARLAQAQDTKRPLNERGATSGRPVGTGVVVGLERDLELPDQAREVLGGGRELLGGGGDLLR